MSSHFTVVYDACVLYPAPLREVTVADGRTMKVPYVGPVKVAFGIRICFVGALMMGDEVLLGAVPMGDLDLVLIPSTRQIMANPTSPNIPHARVKALAGGLHRRHLRVLGGGAGDD